MTKTQIQVPEKLFVEIKNFAARREWTLAETFRRGAELLLETYPADAPPAAANWQPPSSKRVGWKGLSAEQLRDLTVADQARNPLAR